MRIAIIGASGFIGLRATELFHLRGCAEVRPIVRAARSLAVLARMRVDWRICDLLDAEALRRGLEGCGVCVHAAIGDAAQIARMARSAYRACADAGVRRLVWLSSASVHGQNPPAGTDESTALHTDHPIDYNDAKVQAEWALERLARDGRVEVVMLRPGVVYGPRSRWIADTAIHLLEERAGWVNGGRGICNAIFVDNLVEAIRLAAGAGQAAGQSFLLNDAETVSWREFLLPIAESLGLGEAAFREVASMQAPPEGNHRLGALLQSLTLSPIYAQTMRRVPDRAKRLVKGMGRAWPQPHPPENVWQLPDPQRPRMTLEMSQLQECQWRFPISKARAMLGYEPPVRFQEGMRQSVEWLHRVLPMPAKC